MTPKNLTFPGVAISGGKLKLNAARVDAAVARRRIIDGYPTPAPFAPRSAPLRAARVLSLSPFSYYQVIKSFHTMHRYDLSKTFPKALYEPSLIIFKNDIQIHKNY